MLYIIYTLNICFFLNLYINIIQNEKVFSNDPMEPIDSIQKHQLHFDQVKPQSFVHINTHRSILDIMIISQYEVSFSCAILPYTIHIYTSLRLCPGAKLQIETERTHNFSSTCLDCIHGVGPQSV